MRLRAHRRTVVVWSSSGRLAHTRTRRVGRGRRLVRTGTALTILSLLRLARALRPRRGPLLAGTACTVAGLIMRDTAGASILLPGLMLLAFAPLYPAVPGQDQQRLARELSTYSTRAQRHDIEATLASYPDAVTGEMREILARTPCR